MLILIEAALSLVPAQWHLSPESEVHGVFSNINLPSTSGGQPRAIGIVLNVSGDFWKTFANNPHEGFMCLLLESFIDSL